jgi:hypothetical protein
MYGVLAEGYMIRKSASGNRCSRTMSLLYNVLWRQRSQSITGQGAEFHSNWLRIASLHCSGCPSCFSPSSGKPRRYSSPVDNMANLAILPALLHGRFPKGRGSEVGAVAIREGKAHPAGDCQSDKSTDAQLVLCRHGNATSMPRIDHQWAER